MKYSIEWCEVVRQGTGVKGPWKKTKMTLKDENGKTEDDVITFLDVMPGGTLEGTIVPNEQYATREFKKTLEKPNFLKYKDQQMEKVMATKNENIGKVMDRKEDSIRLAGAQRDAVLIVTSLVDLKDAGDYVIQEQITKWRNWFLNDKNFNNPPPF